MRISVFGTGYVGLVTGTCFAEMGHEVICADIDADKIAKLKQGISPIYETGLEDLIQNNTKEERLTFTSDLASAIAKGEALFIAVGTPSDENGSADLRAVLEVARTIAANMTEYKVIVTKSTVPVGSAQQVRQVVQEGLKKRGLHIDFDIVSNPEFLREGTAVEDCLKPSRVIVGCETERAKTLMKRLYEPFLRNGNPLIAMDLASSEMTKYAANAMLATKISFMNELSRLCEKVGADIEHIRSGIGTDPRIGYHFIYPGLGYGGSCFPKDVKALIRTAAQNGEKFSILQSVEDTNHLQRTRFFSRIQTYFQSEGRGGLKGKKIGIWGIAFKPGTDDIREAPAVELIESLCNAGANVVAYDPVAMDAAQVKFAKNSQVQFAPSPVKAIEGVDALCVVTEWKQFREPNLERMKQLMKASVVFDGRNLYRHDEMQEHGFTYYSIGRVGTHKN